MSKESVAVRIAGHNYKILSDGDAGQLRKIAKHVDEAMDQVRKRTGTVDTLDVAVLTCLNLAREVLAVRDQQNGSVEEDRMRALIERVETILGGEVAIRDSATGEGRAAAEAGESARTLDLPSVDLPSVEALRDRTTAAPGANELDPADASMPEARVAAGGRERAS